MFAIFNTDGSIKTLYTRPQPDANAALLNHVCLLSNKPVENKEELESIADAYGVSLGQLIKDAALRVRAEIDVALAHRKFEREVRTAQDRPVLLSTLSNYQAALDAIASTIGARVRRIEIAGVNA